MGQVRKSPFGLSRFQIWLAAAWTLFVVGLASWWMMFSLRLVEQFSVVYPGHVDEIRRHKLMLMSEGSILVVALVAGGVALLVYMIRERAALSSVRDFFVTYTHDLKTALASLRLQTESLYEDLKDQPQKSLLIRLMQDVARLEVQLENSLLLADPKHKLWLKDIDINRVLSSLQYQFAGREIISEIPKQLMVYADERALEAVLRNVLHNSFAHGKATQATIRSFAIDSESSSVTFEILDNGRGFQGDREQLSQPFVRHQPTSGSGIGLFLVRQLVERMNGRLEFPESAHGFVVRLHLPAPQSVSRRNEKANGSTRAESLR